MDVIAHNDIPIDHYVFIENTIIEALNYDVFIALPGKNIYPVDYGECQKIGFVLSRIL